MQKSSLVALIMGTMSGVLFALGMCMSLLPEWNAFKKGILFSTIGMLHFLYGARWRTRSYLK